MYAGPLLGRLFRAGSLVLLALGAAAVAALVAAAVCPAPPPFLPFLGLVDDVSLALLAAS